jgi:hypothetical protein
VKIGLVNDKFNVIYSLILTRINHYITGFYTRSYHNGKPYSQDGDDSEDILSGFEILGQSNVGRILSENYWDGLVKNLSCKALSKAEVELLSLGPQFCPVKRDVDRSSIQAVVRKGRPA